MSQDAVSLAERGRIDHMPVRRLRRIAQALEADLVLTLRWRSGDLDRLLDEGHAALVGWACERLEHVGWEIRPEVTFAVYGERGSIDILAWHAPSRTLLVVEVKTELTSIEETLRRHDVKTRLAAGVAEERFGWSAAQVARLLVLPDTSTARRRIARSGPVLDRAYPDRGQRLRDWLRSPLGATAGLLLMSVPARPRRALARKRICRPRA